MSTTTSGANANNKIQKPLMCVSWQDEEEEEGDSSTDFTELLFATMPQFCIECATFIHDPFVHFSNHERHQPSPTSRSQRLDVLPGEDADQAQREESRYRRGSEEAR